jgi:DNA-binding NarL/FixJ family response regulator
MKNSRLIIATPGNLNGSLFVNYLLTKKFDSILCKSTGDVDRQLATGKFDLLILDELLIPGSELHCYIKRFQSYIEKIILVAEKRNISILQFCIDHDIKGLISRHVDTDELMTCISAVLDGSVYYSPTLLGHIDNNEPVSIIVHESIKSLTVREHEILRKALEHYSAIEIGAQLNISPRTVEAHLRNIKIKLNIPPNVRLKSYLRGLLQQ